MKDDSTSSSFSDGDDVYYRFGGAAICDMLKNRYKAIKKCHSTARNVVCGNFYTTSRENEKHV